MSNTLIATVGRSPAVVTELLTWLNNLRQLPENLYLVYTEDEQVLDGIFCLDTIIKENFQYIKKIKFISLEQKDVNTTEQTFKFMEELGKLIIYEKDNRNNVAVLASGGRKNQTLAIHMICQLTGASRIFHVNYPEIKVYNEKYNANLELFKEHRSKDDFSFRKEHYEQNKEIFDDIFLPSPSLYNIIQLPVLPYPKQIIVKLKKAIKLVEKRADSTIYERDKEIGFDDYFNHEFLLSLAYAGILQKKGFETWRITSDLGQLFFDLIKKI